MARKLECRHCGTFNTAGNVCFCRRSPVVDRKCGTCKYHLQAAHHNDTSAGFVDCRYDPPLITAENRYACLRPLVHKDYWCGRYEADA